MLERVLAAHAGIIHTKVNIQKGIAVGTKRITIMMKAVHTGKQEVNTAQAEQAAAS